MAQSETGLALEQGDGRASPRPESLTIADMHGGHMTRTASNASSSYESTRSNSSASTSSIHSQGSRVVPDGDYSPETPSGQQEDESEVEKKVKQAKKAGKLLEELANQDVSYSGMELFSTKLDEIMTPEGIFSPPPCSPGEDDKPLLIGMTPTPEETPLNVFFRGSYKWRALNIEADGGGMTKLTRRLKRDGSSPCIIKSEAQGWCIRIRKNKLYLCRNGTEHGQVAGVEVVPQKKLQYAEGSLNSMILTDGNGTVEIATGGATSQVFPGKDCPAAALKLFQVNRAGGPATPSSSSLEYSFFLFSEAAYIALNYSTDPANEAETAMLTELSEEHLIEKLESAKSFGKDPGFTPLINVRALPDSRQQDFQIALFFDTSVHRYYIYVEGNSLTLKAVKLCGLPTDDWQRHTQFSSQYYNPGTDTPDSAEEVQASRNGVTTSGRATNGDSSPMGTPSEQPVGQLPDTPGPCGSEEMPEWPTGHDDSVVAHETSGSDQARGATAQANGVKCRASEEADV